MKRYLHTNTPLASLLFAVLLLFATAPAMAQHHQHARMHMPADTSGQMMGMMQGAMMPGGMMGMMQGGMMPMQMMRQAMQHPMQRAGMMVYVLPTMRETLGLSDEQASELTQEKQAFMQERQAIREQHAQKQQQLDELLAAEQPDPAQVESTLKAVATLRAEAQALAYETATTMSAVLSAEQRDQLAAMTPMQMHQHMMTTMPMMEMMQAMHGGMMSGMGCPMMQGAMMQGGMMGMMQDADKQ